MKAEWDFTQPLLTGKEREVALEDMRERTGEISPSLDDCIYIGAVYQHEKTTLLERHPGFKSKLFTK